MTDFLLLTLYAPLASWGDIAVGESRGSWDRPSRSAVLGLVAAALGIRREDEASLASIERGYGVAVRLDVSGMPLSDYHTTQTAVDGTVRAVRRRGAATRRALLAEGDPKTVLSRRQYRQDAVATAAIWARADAPHSLAVVAARFERPAFVLYAGRKSNAFGLPLGPRVVAADTLANALAQRPALDPALPTYVRQRLRSPAGMATLEVSHDPCDGFASGLRLRRREMRRDRVAHRGRWQFVERVVEVSEAAVSTGEVQ